MSLLMSEQMTTWTNEGGNEYVWLREFRSGEMLHLEDTISFLAQPVLSLADVLHEEALSHFLCVISVGRMVAESLQPSAHL